MLVLVEWDSREAFDGYCNDPDLADLHAHRENGTSSYIWHLFDRLDDLRPLLKLSDFGALTTAQRSLAHRNRKP